MRALMIQKRPLRMAKLQIDDGDEAFSGADQVEESQIKEKEKVAVPLKGRDSAKGVA